MPATTGTPAPGVLDPGVVDAWPEIRRLLDEALDQPQERRAAWLEALPPSLAKAHLARVLAAGVETGDLLATLPALSPQALAHLHDGPAGAALKPGDAVGPWRLVRELGRGGMGAVWLAERGDGTLKRPVALKLPLAAWQPGLAERLERERDILASLTHPSIARLYDAGLDALGRPWLALEYVPGEPIDHFVKTRATDLKGRLALVLQVARAVAYAHSRLVIHRDLKPSNILVGDDAQVHLLDFGIAKLMQGERTEDTALTLEAGRMLTPDYASPEQLRGEPLTTASDVYSLGVVAFELLAGVRPYRLDAGGATTLAAALEAAALPLASHRAAAPAERKALRGDLDAVLNKALKKSPAERYATVDAMAADLERHLAGEAVAARPDSALYRAHRLAVRHRRPLALGAVGVAAFGLGVGAGATALVILALLLGLAAAVWQARLARQQAQEARTQAARAQAVQRFLIEIFNVNSEQQAAPQAARQTTARELLDRGAQRVEQALHDTPEARVEVLWALSRMYYQLGQDEQAAALDRRRIELLRQLHGPNHRRVAEALVDLAADLHATADRAETLRLLHEAEAILDATGEGPSAMRGELNLGLARRYQNVDLAKMRHHADVAVQVHGALSKSDRSADPLGLGTALHLAARARLAAGELAESEALHREAESVLAARVPVSHVALNQVRGSAAQCLAQQFRHADALTLLLRADAEARAALGDEDPNVLFVATQLGAALHQVGRRTEGRERLNTTLATLLRTRDADDPLYAAFARRELGRCLFAEGDLAAVPPLYDAAFAAMRKPYAGSPQLAALLTLRGELLTALGKFDDAAAVLEEASGLVRGFGTTRAGNMGVNACLLAQARLRLATGRIDEALADLGRFVPHATGLALPMQQFQHDLLLARAWRQAGRNEAALAQAAATAGAVTASPAAAEAPALLADARFEWAASLLSIGRPREASDALAPALDWRRRFDHPSSPWTAEAERLHAQCRLTLGTSPHDGSAAIG